MQSAQFFPVFVGAALAYLALTIPSGFAVGWLERAGWRCGG